MPQGLLEKIQVQLLLADLALQLLDLPTSLRQIVHFGSRAARLGEYSSFGLARSPDQPQSRRTTEPMRIAPEQPEDTSFALFEKEEEVTEEQP